MPTPVADWQSQIRRLGTQVGEHREYSTMVVVRLLEPQLLEDRPHVALDRTRAQEQSLTDTGVGAALGHQLEDLGLAAAHRLERTTVPSAADETYCERTTTPTSG